MTGNGRLAKLIDRFQQGQADRMPRLRDFWEGRRKYLVVQHAPSDVFRYCRTSDETLEMNVRYLEGSLETPSDHIAYLEPWHGTGVYARSFGSPYRWFEDEAPATAYAFQTVEEAMKPEPLRPADNEVMQLILATIRLFKERFGDAVPICLTDTQSAFDTATLIVDSCNVLTAWYDTPELVMGFLRRINSSIVEFSRMQADLLGDCLARPGHIMPSTPEWDGISISDDNIMFCSPAMNAELTVPINEELGAEFGGVAVHSCGKWAHSMPLVRDMAGGLMLDCSVGPAEVQDCNPPELVRDAVIGSDTILHARLYGDLDTALHSLGVLAQPEIRLVACIWGGGSPADRRHTYDRLNEALAAAYDE